MTGPIWALLTDDIHDENEGCYREIDELDGDIRAVKPLDMSIDIGANPLAITAWWDSGRHMDTTHMPTRLRVTASGCRKDRPAYYCDFGRAFVSTTIVTSAFRDVIEAHDPGIHQFVPVQIEDGHGDVIDLEFFYFAVGYRVFALDRERSQPPVRHYPTGPDWRNPYDDGPAIRADQRGDPKDWVPVFRSEIIGDRDLFCDGGFRNRILISDRLKQALEAADLVGMQFVGPYSVV
ncbi:imm11 family protein [Sinisalibacter aestuarii]|uniref:Immunity MXAN-0049 protein domain-containing protein n=1 Tax=Sinisalibacter aestuarii TaxID=2949426 RepID=A0ABQ5LS83_9RHOB|nr:DUF1629 domain-containing protein [Sinisalibacter aestuarii]GKY87833.1 hypothetical protein STA1M1_17020 [Sinisalibacter aestuarii]